MINLSEQHLSTVKEIICKIIPNDAVWAFGSRITSSFKNHSDLDLVVIRDLDNGLTMRELRKINELFSECALPFKVDVVDWATLDDSFKEIIKNNYQVIQ